MNEESKSIWKKSWKGPRAFFIWLLIVIIVAFFVALAIAGIMFASTPTPLLVWHEGFGSFVRWILKVMAFLFLAIVLAFIFYKTVSWLFHWRNFKRFLFGLACFITLIALFYAEEDWRGKHDWEKFKHQWEAKGERFDWQSVVPPPVPDDQNFAFSPVWIAEEKYEFLNEPKRAEAWYGDRIYSEEVAKILPLLPVSTSTVVGTNIWRFPGPPEKSGDWASGQFLDLKSFQSYYRDLGKTNPAAEIIIASQPQTPAQDVLLALSKFDPVIEKLRQDSARPDSRFPIQYDDADKATILLPHLAAEKRIAQVLQLRAVAELRNDESEKALGDVKLMLRLTDASRAEPFLICHLVRIAILNLTLQPIWEGLAEHKWSDTQLADLDSELAKLDFLADYEFAIRGERNLEIANIEFLRHPDLHNLHWKRPRLYFLVPFFSLAQMLSNMTGSGNDENSKISFPILALGFGPSGWINQNELRLAQFETKWYLPIIDKDAKTISQAKIRAAANALDREMRHRTPENVLETLLMPALGGGARKFAFAQSSADLTRVAIALERYRLARGEFPESLDALAPKFISEIPHDVINGEPLKYRRDPNGQFVLYSVGWNETDDGGAVVLKKSETPGVDINQGDWVWKYPSQN